jgi:hypothetical protein
MVMYLIGMLLQLGDSKIYEYASKAVLSMTFGLMCIRILNLLMVSELVGAKLVMIKKMVNTSLLERYVYHSFMFIRPVNVR